MFCRSAQKIFLLICGMLLCACSAADGRAVSYEEAPIHGATLPGPPEWANLLLGTDLVNSYSIVPASSCLGFVDSLSEIYAGDEGYRFEGWALNKDSGRSFDRIVSADSYLKITGASIMTVQRPDVQAALPALVEDINVGFQLVVFAGTDSSMVFGIDDKSRQACPVAPLTGQ